MHESPRIRRLRNDSAALDRLRSESSVFQFQATGSPPHYYQITFRGKGLWRDRGKIKVIHTHRIEIKLGASYPRTIPEIRWLTPIYHPNISEIGMVCLGGYGTHWVPSVQLDELCTMLWDMARYHNYDIRSPYNRDAALWVANQTTFLFPTDHRALRDLRVAQGRIEASNGNANGDGKPEGTDAAGQRRSGAGRRRSAETAEGSGLPSAVSRVRQFIERYGRVFGEGFILESNATVAAGDSERPLLGAPLPAPSDEVKADPGTAAINSLVSQVEPSRQEEDLIILEENDEIILEENDEPSAEPHHPVRDRTLPRGEDIVFID
jgi:ubiquitin-protein ligase